MNLLNRCGDHARLGRRHAVLCLLPLVVIALWFILQAWVLLRFGVKT